MRSILLLTISFSFISCIYSQGLIRDAKATEHIRQNYRVQKTRSSNLPSSYSLEKYTPHILNQGESDMCTAYSLALARTIVYARNNNLTNKNTISAEAYSPYYIYSKYKSSTDGEFDGGLDMYFNKLNDFGYAKMKEVEYPHYYPFTETQLWDFSVPSYLQLDHDFIKSEKFDEINCIYVEDTSQSGRADFVMMIKSEVAQGRPVIFGMNVFDSFIWSEDYWSDTITTWCNFYVDGAGDYCYVDNSNPSGFCNKHEPDDYYSGHAMTLIGYDDKKYGGAFLIQNSWGREAHNNGKVWIPYDVFSRYAEDVQSLDKKSKTEFEKQTKAYEFNYSDREINFKTKDFSNSLDLNWILFASMAVENKGGGVNTDGYMVLPNNLKVKGELVNNVLAGEGEINLNDIFVYKGQFKGGTFNGKGTLVQYDEWGDIISRKNGDFINGDFTNGDIVELIMSKDPSLLNGFSYKGAVKDGEYSGFGILSNSQYDLDISGQFKYGFPVYGTIKRGADYLYKGEIDYLRPHGKGTVTSNGKIKEGIFEYGNLIK